MTRRWIVLIAVLGLMPILLAMRPVDDVLLKAAFKGDLGEVNTQIKKRLTSTRLIQSASPRSWSQPRRGIGRLWRCCWTMVRR